MEKGTFFYCYAFSLWFQVLRFIFFFFVKHYNILRAYVDKHSFLAVSHKAITFDDQ